MNWTGREAKFCPANFKLGRNSGKDRAGVMWEGIKDRLKKEA